MHKRQGRPFTRSFCLHVARLLTSLICMTTAPGQGAAMEALSPYFHLPLSRFSSFIFAPNLDPTKCGCCCIITAGFQASGNVHLKKESGFDRRPCLGGGTTGTDGRRTPCCRPSMQNVICDRGGRSSSAPSARGLSIKRRNAGGCSI